MVYFDQDDENSGEWLEETLSSWNKCDDVVSPLFISTLLFLQSPPGIDTQDDEK